MESLRKLDTAGPAGLFCRLLANPSAWGCQVPKFGGPHFTDAVVHVQRTVREAAALAATESPIHRLLMKRSQVERMLLFFVLFFGESIQLSEHFFV